MAGHVAGPGFERGLLLRVGLGRENGFPKGEQEPSPGVLPRPFWYENWASKVLIRSK